MATITETTTATPAAAGMSGLMSGLDDCVCLPASWEIYQALLQERGERSRPKYTYVDGRLTVVSPGHHHEGIKTLLGGMIEDILIGMDIDFHGSGSTTLLKSYDTRAGTEGDESYYLRHIKEIEKKKDLVMGEDPAPDLCVEVVYSKAESDAVEAYRRMGVREVWVWRSGELGFLVLGAKGAYAASEVSGLLPFVRAEELTGWLLREDFASDMERRKAFRAWVSETLGPRRNAAIKPGEKQ